MPENSFQQPSVQASQTQPIQSSAPRKKPSWKKIILAIVLAFVTSGVIIGIVLLTFPQIGAVVLVKMNFPKSKYPILYEVPRSIDISTKVPTTQKSQEVVSDGFKFRVPWKNKPKVKEDGLIKFLIFSDTQAIFFDKSIIEIWNEILPNDNTDEYENIKQFYGVEQLDSKYSFYKLVLESNPDDLHIFLPKNEVKASAVLITYKLLLAVPIDGGIYSFETSSIKGFQFGDPKVSDGVDIRFFYKQNNPFMIGVRGATQEEVDFIISSIK